MNELEPTNLHHKKTEVKFSNKLLLERVRRKKIIIYKINKKKSVVDDDIDNAKN